MASGANGEDESVAATVGTLWADFIRLGPGASDNGATPLGEEWPPFTLQHPRWLVIAQDTHVQDNLMEDRLNFWDKTVGYNRWPEKI